MLEALASTALDSRLKSSVTGATNSFVSVVARRFPQRSVSSPVKMFEDGSAAHGVFDRQ